MIAAERKHQQRANNANGASQRIPSPLNAATSGSGSTRSRATPNGAGKGKGKSSGSKMPLTTLAESEDGRLIPQPLEDGADSENISSPTGEEFGGSGARVPELTRLSVHAELRRIEPAKTPTAVCARLLFFAILYIGFPLLVFPAVYIHVFCIFMHSLSKFGLQL